MFHVRVLNPTLTTEDVHVCSPTLFHDRRSYLWISGPESAEKRILAITTFVRALKEVTTEVDDDDDPQDAIKEYGKQLVKSLTLIGIGEAAGIGRIVRKAWKKTKSLPQYKLWGPKRWNYEAPAFTDYSESTPPGAAPAVAPPFPQTLLGYASHPSCTVCGRKGHNEATCYTAHPEMRPVMRP